MDFRKQICRWWDGKFVPFENDPHLPVVFVGGSTERHWTSRFARAVVEYVVENHRWLISTIVAAIGVLAGIIIALLHVPK